LAGHSPHELSAKDGLLDDLRTRFRCDCCRRRYDYLENDGADGVIHRCNGSKMTMPTGTSKVTLDVARIYELIATGELEIAKDRCCSLVLVSGLRDVVALRVIRAGVGAGSRPCD